KLAIRGVTLEGGQLFQPQSTFGSPSDFWIDDCALNGSGRWVTGSHPIGINWKRRYLTDSAIHDVNFVAQEGTDCCRGLDIDRIGNDAFEGTHFVVNCSVDDQDPGTTGWHADVWQNPPASQED